MKILHMDIETAPNTGYFWALKEQYISPNQVVESSYTMCWAAKWHKKNKVYFGRVYYGVGGKVIESSKKKMLQEMWKLLDEADMVVHYYGTKFDIPTLNKEFLLHGIDPPTPFHQMDLLSTVRRNFKFLSGKLDYVSQMLGLGKKHPHTGFQLWIDCMHNCDKAWKTMKKYNMQDVRMLEPLYVKLLPWIKNHPNHGLFTLKEGMVCPNCESTHIHKKGLETTKEMTYQRLKCQNCGLNIKGKQSLLSKEKRKIMVTASKL